MSTSFTRENGAVNVYYCAWDGLGAPHLKKKKKKKKNKGEGDEKINESFSQSVIHC